MLVGETATVTGETTRPSHGFAIGERILLLEERENWWDGRPLPLAWRASSLDYPEKKKYWILPADMDAGPTETEIEEAIQSIKTRETIVNTPRKHSPHFFNREADGTVRLRIRFDPEEAALFEEAAGETPVMVWLHRTLEKEARRQVKEARRKRGKVDPPREGSYE